MASFLLAGAIAHAATITSNGTGGGNWSAGASWVGGVAPLGGDDAIIAAGDQINLTTNQTCVNVRINGTLNLNTNNRTLTVNGGLTLSGNGAITGNGTTRMVNVAGGLTVDPATSVSIAGNAISFNGPSAVNGTLTFTSNAASRTFNGDVTVSGTLRFNANVTLTLNAKLIAANGSTIGSGGGTGTLNVAGNLVVSPGATTALDTLNLTCGALANIQGTAGLTGGTYNFRDLLITGNGVLDASGGISALNVSGNWTNTSAAADPFVQGTCAVTFNGNSGTQQVNVTGGTETFHRLVINNTSVTSPGVLTNANLVANDDFDHSSGVLDLAGNSLTISGSATGQTHALNGGSIITSAVGAAFVVNDPNNVDRTTFTNYRLGTSALGVTANVTCGRLSFVGFTQYGTAVFTKTLNVDDVFGGGNYYHGPVTFTATATASRWRMGDNIALPDTFVSATFNANALAGTNNNFIIGANSQGNAFYGTTRMTSTTVGGFFICRQNGNGTSSATFHGPVIPRVTHTGNITFADSDPTHANVVTFNGTVQAQSSMTSTGDIYFGNSSYSTINVSPTGQFIPGTVQGMTSVHFRKVTQVGSLPQSLIGISNSRIYCGGTAYPNTFNGTVDFKADTVQINSTTFNDNADVWGMSHLTLAYNAFNGGVNNFTKQGVGNSSSTGGNNFITGSQNTFTSFGSGYMRLAATVPDDMNGDVRYLQSGGGALTPAYGTACTYSGDISTMGSAIAIQFSNGAGSVILDGAAQAIIGDAARPPLFYRLVTALSDSLSMDVNATVRNTLTMSSGRIGLNGHTLTLGISTATPGTLNHASGWFHGGAFTRWVAAPAISLGNVAGLFPMGGATSEYRPIWFGSTANLTSGGTISVQHTPTNTGHSNSAFLDASWGSTVWGVSHAAWPVVTGNGLTVNGSTARLRFGGSGFSPFVLTDLNATLAGSVVGTFGAATSAVVPLEVNRTALSTAQLSNTWHIGTRNTITSPLPVELLYFDAEPAGDAVALTWATATENGSDHFLVERSADAENWSLAAEQPAAGNSTSVIHYAALDADPLRGTSYYRLRQFDIDGTFTTAPVVMVNMRSDAALLVYPNPASGIVQVTGVPVGEQVNLFDAQGHRIASAVSTAQGVSFDTAVLAPGTYMVRGTTGASRIQVIH